jgi:hypothetical protein
VSCRWKLNTTSDDVRSLPLANVRPGLRVTVNSLGEVKAAVSAMSGTASGLPSGELSRNGYTWFITRNEPLS